MTLEHQPSIWIWILASIVFVFLVYLDLKTRSQKLRILRVTSTLLLVLALVGIYVKPSLSRLVPENKLVIKTVGAEKNVLDSLENLGFSTTVSSLSLSLVLSSQTFLEQKTTLLLTHWKNSKLKNFSCSSRAAATITFQ